MRRFVTGILIALAWAAATGAFNLANLMLGFVLGIVAMVLVGDGRPGAANFARTRGVLSLFVLLITNLGASAVHCALLAIRPRATVRPGLLTYPLKATRDFEVNLLALLVTLAPGIMAVELTPGRREMIVHAFNAADAERLGIVIAERFERRIMEVFG